MKNTVNQKAIFFTCLNDIVEYLQGRINTTESDIDYTRKIFCDNPNDCYCLKELTDFKLRLDSYTTIMSTLVELSNSYSD